MTKQEAKILASELEGNRHWHVPRVAHGMDPIDGWYVVIELRQHAHYRVLLSDHRYARPQLMADYQQTLEERFQDSRTTSMLLVPLPTGEYMVMS